MNAKTEVQSSSFNSLKWLVVVLLVAAGIGGNIFYADQSLLYRVIALVVIAIAAVMIAIQTSQGAAFWSLAKEARTEIRKVVWPTREETTQTTLIVLGFVILMGLLLWGLDTFFGWVVSLIIG